jgi:hypothetical protein
MMDRDTSGSPTGAGDAGNGADRRRNRVLRELLDELLELARDISRHARAMSPSELEHAQERIEWLADEIYSAAVSGQQS